MADRAWFSALLILFCLSPGILRQPPLLAREREATFSVHVRLMVLKLASLEKKKKKKENDDFRSKKILFLGFYKAERKSEDIFVLRRVRAFSRYLFCWL